MGLNIVDINVFYSTFTLVFFNFLTSYVFQKNIFERFYIYGWKCCGIVVRRLWLTEVLVYNVCSVPALKTLKPETLSTLADVLEEVG